VEEVAVRARSNGKGPRHVIWFATKGSRSWRLADRRRMFDQRSVPIAWKIALAGGGLSQCRWRTSQRSLCARKNSIAAWLSAFWKGLSHPPHQIGRT